MNFRLPKTFGISVMTLAFLAMPFIGPGGLLQPLTVSKDTMILYIPRGTRSVDIAREVSRQGYITHPWFFLFGTVLTGTYKNLKAGEYQLAYGMNPWELIAQMAAGNSIIRNVTVPEGYTVFRICKLLEENPYLEGNIVHVPPEGLAFPDTYRYLRGDGRQQLLDRMRLKMEKVAGRLWQNRPQTCKLQTREEMMTLASIIEKETATAHERALVSGVMMNRLKRRMPLQTDPTVIYAVTQGTGILERCLNKEDMRLDSPYNTYLNLGLPPGPIACPGKAAMIAALNPADTSYLYFVTDGNGGHRFSTNYAGHRQNIQLWINNSKGS